MHGRDGISPLDKCLRRTRYIRDQTLAYSASAVFADPNRLFGESSSQFEQCQLFDAEKSEIPKLFGREVQLPSNTEQLKKEQ